MKPQRCFHAVRSFLNQRLLGCCPVQAADCAAGDRDDVLAVVRLVSVGLRQLLLGCCLWPEVSVQQLQQLFQRQVRIPSGCQRLLPHAVCGHVSSAAEAVRWPEARLVQRFPVLVLLSFFVSVSADSRLLRLWILFCRDGFFEGC